MEAHDMKNNGKELAGCYDSICNNDSNFTAIEIVGFSLPGDPRCGLPRQRNWRMQPPTFLSICVGKMHLDTLFSDQTQIADQQTNNLYILDRED